MYVADGGNRRVQVFDAAGRFVASWQGGDERFVRPSAVAWDEKGYVLVLDSDTGWIRRFTDDGRFLGEFGGPEAGFLCPCWLAVSEAGQIYVLDSGNNRVQVLEPIAR